MIKIDLTPEAGRDLAEIAAFSVEHYGRDATAAYLDRLAAMLARLCDYPGLAPAYPGIQPPIRSIVCGRHRIFYRTIDVRLIVVRILHVARDVDGAFDDAR